MATDPRPLLSPRHRSTNPGSRSPGASTTARRLGISYASLLAYLDANGGAPDGRDHRREEDPRTRR